VPWSRELTAAEAERITPVTVLGGWDPTRAEPVPFDPPAIERTSADVAAPRVTPRS
jgi:hypothetical protein